jgi:hypothetical protein
MKDLISNFKKAISNFRLELSDVDSARLDIESEDIINYATEVKRKNISLIKANIEAKKNLYEVELEIKALSKERNELLKRLSEKL